ncbi:MAG TPA: HAMP domain-containing histidine kinase [Clostridiales bacterium]|nr:HAMP domain-containing histidine kinase [Clostridiales bacterium]
MSEYQLDFIRRCQSLFYVYRNFPLPVIICNCQWKVYFSNELANRYYEGATTTQGLASLLAEFDRDELLRQAVETGNCTLKEVLPLSSVNLSITPILENGKAEGLVLMFIRMDNYIDSKVYYQGTRMAETLANGIRQTVGDVFSTLDCVYQKAELMHTTWMQESFNLVALQGYSVLRLASNLTEYSRYQSGLLDLSIEEIDLKAYLEQIQKAAEPISHALQIPLRFQLPDESLYVAADIARLEAAFFNILHNAFYFTKEGNEVEVALSLSSDGDRVLLRVSDKGLGIPAEVLPDVTRPYFSYQHACSGLGAGLGLAIARLMANAHDGDLDIRSQPRKGTTVTLSLPVSRGTNTLRLEQELEPPVISDRFAPIYVGLISAALSPNGNVLSEGRK